MYSEKIIEKIKKAKYFSIGFDETSDVAKIEQMVLVIRYLDKEEIREDFLTFIDCFKTLKEINNDQINSLTGLNISKIVIRRLLEFGLNLNNAVGIATDGASCMTSEKIDAVKFIKGSFIDKNTYLIFLEI